jgi:hypothetical protein
MPKRTTKRRSGRQTNLTPEIGASICDGVREGLPLKTAAGIAGVPYATVREWISKGKDGVEPFLDFAADIEISQAFAQRDYLRRMTAAKGDPRRQRVLAHVFERLYPGLFDPDHATRVLERQRLRTEMNKNNGGGAGVLSEEDFARIFAGRASKAKPPASGAPPVGDE